MNGNSLLRSMLFPLVTAAAGCSGSNIPALDKSFDVVLRACSDEGLPVDGVKFTHGALSLGTTDPTGKVVVKVNGVDGQTVEVATTCPDGYLAPEQPAQLRLAEVHRLDSTAPGTIELQVVCTRKMRDIVLVVRTNSAPVLPVEVAGKPVGSTNEHGQSHFHFQLDRSVNRMSVSLATTAAPALRPQNPSRVFELDGQDAVLLFDQSFAVDRPAPPPRRVVVAKKRVEEPVRPIPYRIDSGRSHAF